MGLQIAKSFITQLIANPHRKPSARLVYPLTAASQPHLDRLGPSKVDKHELSLAWVSYRDAKWAIENWHYSRSVPAGKTVKVGVFEQRQFIGVVIFSRGSTPKIGAPYGLEQTQVCELTRVALDAHKSPVSQIISEAIAMLRQQNPGLRLIVSYAATEEGHHGGIYQAGNWIYVGCKDSYKYRVGNQLIHGRTMSMRAGRMGLSGAEYLTHIGHPKAPRLRVYRHKYLMPLDRKTRRQIAGLSQDAPKPSTDTVCGQGQL